MTADDPNVPVDEVARRDRYAEAIRGVLDDFDSVMNVRVETQEVARRVLAVADSELAGLRAEVERLKRGGKELGRILDRSLRDALDASGRHDVIAEDGDGDWEVVWETLAGLRPRAEAAEAELRALREGIEALADEVGDGQSQRTVSDWLNDLRALLDPSPAATTGEALCARDVGDPPEVCRCLLPRGHAGIHSCKHTVDTIPAPVSSGEAGTGEAWPLSREEQRRLDNKPCPHCGGDRLRPNFTGDNGVCHAGGRPYPAPVVAPSDTKDGAS